MGSDHPGGREDERPVHTVTLTRGFFLGVYPVTQDQWRAVMGTDPSDFHGPDRPVEQVSWDDAWAFCARLTEALAGRARVRLPTEAEWEWACRAGTTTEFHFGDVISTDLANFNGTADWEEAQIWHGSPDGVFRQETTVVGVFPQNAWGLFDMHGNVREWCADRFAHYTPDAQTDPNEKTDGLSEFEVVSRGGSWIDGPDSCRSADRLSGRPTDANAWDGFRVAFRLD